MSSEELITINTIWNLVIAYGTTSRLFKLNGLDSWSKLKEIFASIDIDPSVDWIDDAKKRTSEMLSMGIIGTESPEMPTEHTTWELHHFFIQHGKIIRPVDESKKITPVSFVKIMQIAYNAGQLNAEMNINKNTIYEEKWKAYYTSNMLDQITSYVNPRIIISDKVNKKLKKTIERLILEMTMTRPSIEGRVGMAGGAKTKVLENKKSGDYSKIRTIKFRIQPNFI
jgi:hypothetical protein